jgi:SPP1 family predicted phage head-tail adaptor
MTLKPNNIASRLKQRIVIERPVYAFDSMAASIETWEKTEEAWAEVNVISSVEKEHADRLITTANYQVFIRKYHAVQPEMRFVFKTKPLTIRAIINNPNEAELIEVLAEGDM